MESPATHITESSGSHPEWVETREARKLAGDLGRRRMDQVATDEPEPADGRIRKRRLPDGSVRWHRTDCEAYRRRRKPSDAEIRADVVADERDRAAGLEARREVLRAAAAERDAAVTAHAEIAQRNLLCASTCDDPEPLPELPIDPLPELMAVERSIARILGLELHVAALDAERLSPKLDRGWRRVGADDRGLMALWRATPEARPLRELRDAELMLRVAHGTGTLAQAEHSLALAQHREALAERNAKAEAIEPLIAQARAALRELRSLTAAAETIERDGGGAMPTRAIDFARQRGEMSMPAIGVRFAHDAPLALINLSEGERGK